jgi:hypothetical protein
MLLYFVNEVCYEGTGTWLQNGCVLCCAVLCCAVHFNHYGYLFCMPKRLLAVLHWVGMQVCFCTGPALVLQTASAELFFVGLHTDRLYVEALPACCCVDSALLGSSHARFMVLTPACRFMA